MIGTSQADNSPRQRSRKTTLLSCADSIYSEVDPVVISQLAWSRECTDIGAITTLHSECIATGKSCSQVRHMRRQLLCLRFGYTRSSSPWLWTRVAAVRRFIVSFAQPFRKVVQKQTRHRKCKHLAAGVHKKLDFCKDKVLPC